MHWRHYDLSNLFVGDTLDYFSRRSSLNLHHSITLSSKNRSAGGNTTSSVSRGDEERAEDYQDEDCSSNNKVMVTKRLRTCHSLPANLTLPSKIHIDYRSVTSDNP